MARIVQDPLTLPEFVAQSSVHLTEMLSCPGCVGGLEVEDGRYACANCGHRFQSEDEIPLLFWPNDWSPSEQDVTEVERSFYEENLFPNYDDADSVATLADKARSGIFAQLLD